MFARDRSSSEPDSTQASVVAFSPIRNDGLALLADSSIRLSTHHAHPFPSSLVIKPLSQVKRAR